MKNKETLIKIVAVAIALTLWQTVSMVLNRKLLLCSPIDVLVNLPEIIFRKGFLSVLWFSLSRVCLGFCIAFVSGIIFGLLAGKYPHIETLLWPYMITIRTVPVASFIILSLVFLSGKQLSVFISFLMVLPVIYSNVLQGAKSADKEMLEMAFCFHMKHKYKMRYIIFPSIYPFLISGSKAALGLCWKAGIAAEVIAVVRGSIGEKLYESKVYFETADLFAWTLIIVLASLILEKVILWIISTFYKRAIGIE